MGCRSVAVFVTERQREVLESLAHSKTEEQRLVERARVILMSAEGRHNEDQAEDWGVDRQCVRRWRHRWARAWESLIGAEKEKATDKDFTKLILGVLTDHERSGAPSKFSAEQIASMISLACESPADSGFPVSHWTPAELAREAIKRGIVESISPRHVDRFLAKRPCDRTRASIGSPRRTSVKHPSNIKRTWKNSVTHT